MLDQEENGVTNISDNLDYSWDCCSDYQNPHRTPRIYPRKPTMNAGTNINLYLKLVHPYCYASCFTWRITSGGGYLDPEFGIETYYHAPAENELCGQNPTIEARCPRERLDVIQIGINGYKVRKLACFEIASWKTDKQYSYKVLRNMVDDVGAYRILRPDFATTTIYHRDCAGKHLATTHADVFQIASLDALMKPRGLFDRWMGVSYSPEGSPFMREVGPTYGKGKRETLTRLLGPFVDWGLPAGETVAHWLPFWKDWAAGKQPAAGGVADVRNWEQLKGGCCNRYLVRELDELPGRAL